MTDDADLMRRLKHADSNVYCLPGVTEPASIFLEAANRISALEAEVADWKRNAITLSELSIELTAQIETARTAEADMRERAAAVCKIESFKHCPNCNTAANAIRALPLSTDAAPTHDTIAEGA